MAQGELTEEKGISLESTTVDVQKLLEEYEGGATARTTGVEFWDKVINS